MKINKLRIKNFKSFYDETTIDFSKMKGLYKVSGQIGSGKTTIGEAIIYGLYGNVTGKTLPSMISWGEKHGSVEIWCESFNKDIYIKRELNAYGQSPMYVEVDNEEIVFTNKRNAQQQLEKEYFDTNKTMMELLCIISFNSFKSLSTLNAKDTRQFLDYVMGFDVLTDYVDACKIKQSELKDNKLNITATINANNVQINRLESYEKPIDTTPISDSIKQINEEIVEKEKYYKSQIDELSSKRNELQSKLTEIKTLGAAKSKEIKLIKTGKCPTCGASIDKSQLSQKKQERQILLEHYNDIHSLFCDLTGQISQISVEMTNCITSKKSVVKSKENELIRLTEKSKQTAETQKELMRLKNENNELKIKLESIEVEIESYNELSKILSIDIRQQILGSFIPSVNAKIIELSNMSGTGFVPEFDNNFKCIIKSETDDISTSSLSTGQLKVVDTIIILAIISSIMSKSKSNIIFLDELFSNLDSKTRSDMVSILRCALPEDSVVLIVSHQDIDEDFDGCIKLKLENKNGFRRTKFELNRY